MDYSKVKDFTLDAASYARLMASNDHLRLNNGAKLDLYSSSILNTEEENGCFKLSAKTNDGNYIDLVGDGKGNLTWNGLPLSTTSIEIDIESIRRELENLINENNLNYVTKANGEISTELTVTSGRDAIFRKNGARLYLCGFDDTELPGTFILRSPADKNCETYWDLMGDSNGNLTWGGHKLIYTTKDYYALGTIEIKFSNGYAVKSGLSYVASGTNRTFKSVTLGEPFRDGNYFVCATSHRKTWHVDGDVNIYNKDSSHFEFTCADGVEYISWFAFGKYI